VVTSAHLLLALVMISSPRLSALGQYFEQPLIELFRIYVRGVPTVEIPALRSGPDRLHWESFDASPWPIAAVAYWYQEHFRCFDPQCRCRRIGRFGDGLCAIAYQDGLYGVYPLTPDGYGERAIPWHRLDESDRVTEYEFSWIMESCEHGLGSARWWEARSPDSPVGVAAAVRAGRRQGMFPPGEFGSGRTRRTSGPR
jgi:hypothetical protein